MQNCSSRISERFDPYDVTLYAARNFKEKLRVQTHQHIDSIVNQAFIHISQYHTHFSISYADRPERNILQERVCHFEKSSGLLGYALKFIPFEWQIIIQPTPIETQDMGNGKNRYAFADGFREEFTNIDHTYCFGTRYFPDGKKEHGKFYKDTRSLRNGYIINLQGSIEFVDPEWMASVTEEPEKFYIMEIEEKLVVLTKIQDATEKYTYIFTDKSVLRILLQACRTNNEGVKVVLEHPDFTKHLQPFFKEIFAPDENGVPYLLGFTENAAIDALEATSKDRDIDPLKIVDTHSGRHLFLHAVHKNDEQLFSFLIEKYPTSFFKDGLEIIEARLRQGRGVWRIVEKYEAMGGSLDRFHSLWMRITDTRTPLDEKFKTDFESLLERQKREIYNTAFDFNNLYLIEPPEIPVKPEQYSVNLMWINASKISPEQEFLMQKEVSNDEDELDDSPSSKNNQQYFQSHFVEPISQWALSNPGTRINIWIDSVMATPGAIERSKQALEQHLNGQMHGDLVFRDVREIPLVNSHANVFAKNMPVYFRVDLLRAMAAEYSLRNKETEFFVYADIDMKPYSGQRLFDKRTLGFLKDFGFVLAKGGYHGFENGFQILNGTHQIFMESHRKVIIDLSLEMATQRPKDIREQQIYDTYPAMFTYFLCKVGRYGTPDPMLFKKDSPTELDESLFRYDEFSKVRNKVHMPFMGAKVMLRKTIPTKPVELPPHITR